MINSVNNYIQDSIIGTAHGPCLDGLVYNDDFDSRSVVPDMSKEEILASVEGRWFIFNIYNKKNFELFTDEEMLDMLVRHILKFRNNREYIAEHIFRTSILSEDMKLKVQEKLVIENFYNIGIIYPIDSLMDDEFIVSKMPDDMNDDYVLYYLDNDFLY